VFYSASFFHNVNIKPNEGEQEMWDVYKFEGSLYFFSFPAPLSKATVFLFPFEASLSCVR